LCIIIVCSNSYLCKKFSNYLIILVLFILVKFISFLVFSLWGFSRAVHSSHLIFAVLLVQDSIGVILSVLEIVGNCGFIVVELDLVVDELLKFTSL